MFFKSFYTLLFFIVFSFLFALAALITAFICSPKTKNSTKTTTYECGITPSGDAKINFSIKYYLYAILFIVFEIETLFLFPIAVIFKKMETFILIEVIFFLITLGLGFIYSYKKNMLEWK